MPGIIGFVSNNSTEEELLDRMIDSIKHKEWQQIDKHVESPFSIARVHLGIFNPEPQPIFNEDKTLCIFMYGKIYGYEEEMEKLKDKHNFIYNNDPEFCLHAYEEYGKEFVKKLNGSFDIVICNFRKKELIILNDRYGLHPFYYTINNGKLLFASEIKAILQDETFKKELNDETIADFFAFGEIFGNKTFFNGIEVMPPASIFTYDGKNISTEQYWDPNYEPDYNKSEDEFVDELIKSVKKAMEIRMKDNLCYGIALSGGLDSRVVLGAINKERRKDIVTFTFGIPGCDEAKIAEVVSKVAGTKHIFIPIDPNEVLTPYPEKTIYCTEGEFPIHISHQAFALERINHYVDVSFDGLAGALLSGGFLSKQVLRAKSYEELLEILNRRRFFSDYVMKKLFTDDYYDKIKDMPFQSVKSSLDKTAGHSVSRYDCFMLKNREKRLNTKGGVEIIRNMVKQVTPMFDNNFFDIIQRIPPELRFQHRIYRKFLKKLAPELARIPYNTTMIRADAPLILWKIASFYQFAKGIFERQIWWISRGRIYLANKRHYAPVDEWLRVNQSWRKFARDTLLSVSAFIKDFCRQEFIKTLIEEHESGKANHFNKINYLITFELFLQMFVAGSLQVEP
jgi:asparagine synthase (glutamine-hydrolysing)